MGTRNADRVPRNAEPTRNNRTGIKFPGGRGTDRVPRAHGAAGSSAEPKASKNKRTGSRGGSRWLAVARGDSRWQHLGPRWVRGGSRWFAVPGGIVVAAFGLTVAGLRHPGWPPGAAEPAGNKNVHGTGGVARNTTWERTAGKTNGTARNTALFLVTAGPAAENGFPKRQTPPALENQPTITKPTARSRKRFSQTPNPARVYTKYVWYRVSSITHNFVCKLCFFSINNK
jgi:hypothetical protein